jgi:multidrug efflux system outer membrane protein
MAAWEESKLQYERTVLEAFLEVAEALVLIQTLEASRVDLEVAVRAYRDAVSLAIDRYKAGKANYYEVLEAQEELYTQETTLVRTQRDQRLAVVQLYKALGGGWQTMESSL